MSPDSFSRRGFLAGVGGLGAATLLGGCATSATTSTTGEQTAGALTIQSNLSAPTAKAAMQALVDGFNARKGAQATLNTVASETYRTQLPSYLTSTQPSDLYTWYAGSVAR